MLPRRRIPSALASSLLSLLASSTVSASQLHPLEERYATITARAAAPVQTQTVLPFYFGPPNAYDPPIDMGSLFFASVITANVSYTAISLACQPTDVIQSGFECNLADTGFWATCIDGSTWVHSFTSSGPGDPGSGGTSTNVGIVDTCVFVDDNSLSANCSATKTDTEVMDAGQTYDRPMEEATYTVTSTAIYLDNIPITAGAEKLPPPTNTPGATGGSGGGSGGGGSGGTSSSPHKGAAGQGKKDRIMESGSTFGLMIGVLAWAII
jgi:hypothetical protein